MAVTKNTDVAIAPPTKVMNGNPLKLAVGINAPTTSEPKIILAPSRKKFAMTRGWISSIINSVYQNFKYNVNAIKNVAFFQERC